MASLVTIKNVENPQQRIKRYTLIMNLWKIFKKYFFSNLRFKFIATLFLSAILAACGLHLIDIIIVATIYFIVWCFCGVLAMLL